MYRPEWQQGQQTAVEQVSSPWVPTYHHGCYFLCGVILGMILGIWLVRKCGG